MRTASFTIVALALLALSGAAGAESLHVNLQAHNQRSSSGTLSTLKWKACSPTAADNPCLSTTNAWTLANVTPSDAVWSWDPGTGILSMTGTFQTTSFVSSNPNGSSVISDKVVNMTINTQTQTTTAATYQCVEGTFLANVGANGCLNTSLGGNFSDESSALYNVGGSANCVQRTIGGDDTSTGNPRGLFTAGSVGACDPVDGAFDLWTVEQDNTATGGTLIIRSSVPLASNGSNYLTFTAGKNALDDGPVNVLEGGTVSIDVLANDLNFTDNVTVNVSTAPTKGSAVVMGTSPGPQAGITIEYTANVGASGTDTFVYTVLDGDGTTSDTATVTINILQGGANDDTASTTRNSGAININVGANDTGFTDPVTIVITTPPDQGGSATAPAPGGTIANAIISYTPGTKPAGIATYTETFTYQVTDSSAPVPLVSSATVTVTVNNTVPVANPGSITISTQGFNPANTSGTFNAATGNTLGNLPATIATSALVGGTTSVLGTVVTFTPAAGNYTGPASFTYTITDADGETASNTVTVALPDVSPSLAGDPSTTGNQGTVLIGSGAFTAGNGSVAQHSLSVATPPASGSCVPSFSGSNVSVSYTPAPGFSGNDSCVIRITDGDGDTGDGTYSFTVNAAAGGGGGGGGLLPGGGGGSFELWSLAVLGGLPLLRRRRSARGSRAGT